MNPQNLSPPKRSNSISSVNEEIFQVLSHYGPVTALKFYSRYIICGYGSILKVFEIVNDSQHKLIFDQQILSRNKIHNISLSSCGERLLLAGGRSFIILTFSDILKNQESVCCEKAINEWIISSEFLDIDTVLILTSHNIVYKIGISTHENTKKYELKDKIHCNEKSILYTGSIRKIGDRVLVAAGTVMGGVIIWDLVSRKILHNLTDHEGSIFGVRIDAQGKYIISCSDDRSIKLYDFTSGELLASGWGHGSRIWNLEFFKNQDTLRLFSTGEDCTARAWEYEKGNQTLKQVEVWDCHLGKHVWSGDLDDVSLKFSVTGGADGRVRLHDLSLLENENRKSFSMNLIESETNIKFNKNEIIKQYFELPQLDLLIVLTSSGKLFSLNQKTLNWEIIKLSIEEMNKFNNFGLIRGFTDLNVIVVCPRNGDMLVLKFDESQNLPVSKTWITDEYLKGNKVTNVLTSSNREMNQYFVLTDCPNPKVPFILRCFSFENGEFKCDQVIQLMQPDQTSFTTTCMNYDSINNILIIGSRYVSIAIYDLSINLDTLELSALFKKLSAGDTITSISTIESQHNSIRNLITVRDGVYMFVEITRQNEKFTVDIIHENKLSKGFVEGGFIKENDLILYGFKSSYFYIWNESKQLEVTSELCGGAHRQWELFKYEDAPVDFKFAYISKSILHIKSFSQRFKDGNNGLINNGTHGREIRDVAISPSKLPNEDARLILTASEDTTVRIGKLFNTGEIRSYWSMNHHISGLQKIKFLDDEYVGSSAANEEFYIWKLNELSNRIPIIVNSAKIIPSQTNPDLRIMDFDSHPFLNGFVISTVYSDSNIKIWYYDCVLNKFTLLANDNYTTCCILNVNFLQFDNNSRIHLMIGTTDGYLTIWDVTDIISNFNGESSETVKLSTMIIKQQLHQNGVKAVLCLPDGPNSYSIFTGGDDNALISSTLDFNPENSELLFSTNSFVEDAASSTITSISDARNGKILVTSVDQIVRIWEFSDTSLACKTARYTTIADTGCSDVSSFDDKNIAVIGGAGLSAWKF